jgi:hypothetical protein
MNAICDRINKVSLDISLIIDTLMYKSSGTGSDEELLADKLIDIRYELNKLLLDPGGWRKTLSEFTTKRPPG